MDTYVEAEYESGYIHRENESDRSPYIRDKNTFDDILNGRPCDVHGKMIRFSVVVGDNRHDIDWTLLPDCARPIRFKHMERQSVGGTWIEEPRIVTVDFGYQFTTGDGQNVQEVWEIR